MPLSEIKQALKNGFLAVFTLKKYDTCIKIVKDWNPNMYGCLPALWASPNAGNWVDPKSGVYDINIITEDDYINILSQLCSELNEN